jgi:hypothetical protein
MPAGNHRHHNLWPMGTINPHRSSNAPRVRGPPAIMPGAPDTATRSRLDADKALS